MFQAHFVCFLPQGWNPPFLQGAWLRVASGLVVVSRDFLTFFKKMRTCIQARTGISSAALLFQSLS